MTSEGMLRPPKWKELYYVAMLESALDKLPARLNDAINAVLDQIEETRRHLELEQLNNALNALRSRRKEVSSSKDGRSGGSDQARVA